MYIQSVRATVLSWLRCGTEMTNITRLPEYYWTYEYYIGYVDPHPVDARQLKANRCKYSFFVSQKIAKD